MPFDYADVDLHQKLQSKRVNPVLFRGRAPRVTVIVDRFLRPRELENFLYLLRRVSVADHFEIVYGLKVVPEKVTSGVHWFIAINRVNPEVLLTPGRNVVTIGNALTVITRDGDVGPEAFLDSVWNSTSLEYHPNKCNVFPTLPLTDILSESGRAKDNFAAFHFFGQIKRALEQPYVPRRMPQIKTEIVENPNEFLLSHLGPKEVAWDLETGGFDFVDDKIGCLTISFDGITGYYLRWKDIDPEIFDRFLLGKFQIGANKKFDDRFVRKQGLKNARVDLDTMQLGHILNEIRSNSLKTHAWIYTTIGGYDFELEKWKRDNPRIKSYLDIPEEVLSKYAALDAVATFQAARAMRRQLRQDPQLEKYFFEYIMPVLNMFTDIEYEGIPIDWDKLVKLRILLDEKLVEIKERCYAALGTRNVDLDSGKQLGFHLQKIGLPDLGRAKEKLDDSGEIISGGYYLSGKDVLIEWFKLGHTEVAPLLEYSKWSAVRNSFCGTSIQGMVDTREEILMDFSQFFDVEENSKYKPRSKKADTPGYRKYRSSDGLIHSNFLVFYAASHRHRSSNPNLQNITKRDKEIAMLVRAIFKTPNDAEFYIGEIDAAGFQLRIACAQSGEPNMRKAFLEVPGGDLHSVTAQFVFRPNMSLAEFLQLKDDGDKVIKSLRNKSKGINFGLIFGAAPSVIMTTTLMPEWTDEEAYAFVREKELELRVEELLAGGKTRRIASFLACAEFIRTKFFELYPGLLTWHQRNANFAMENGYIRSPFGARRLLPWLTYTGSDSDGAEIKNHKNIAANSPVQNHEVIPISMAMLKIHNLIKERGLKSRIALTVHDSIVIFIHKSELNVIVKCALEAMRFDWPQHQGVPVFGEMNIANPRKGEVWGFGKLEVTDDNYSKMLDLLNETELQVA